MPPTDLDRYLAALRRLPFVRGLQILTPDRKTGLARPNAILAVKTPRSTAEFLVEVKKTHLTYATAGGLLHQIDRTAKRPWILFAKYVGREMAEFLATRGVNYVDEVGNCNLAIGEEYIARIGGRTQARRPREGRGLGAPAYKVMFTLLARPELLDTPARQIAAVAAVAPATVTNTLARLEAENLVGRGATRRRLLDAGTLRDRWLTGYANLLRPRLFLGRFKHPDRDADALERRVEADMGDRPWAWGGGVAALRLTGHYRGEETVIHVDEARGDVITRLRLVPAREGDVLLLGVPGQAAFQGIKPRTVHPLLIYAELMTIPDERARETAQEIGERYLWTQP